MGPTQSGLIRLVAGSATSSLRSTTLPGLAGWRWASPQLLMLLLILYRRTGLGKVRFQMPESASRMADAVEVSRIGVRAGRSGIGKGFGCRPGASDRPGIGAGVGKPPVQPRVMALGPNTAKELAGRGCSRRGRGRVIHYPVIRDLDARATAGFKVDLS